MGSQDGQQLRLEAAEDKKAASLWLAAMHKVDTPDRQVASALARRKRKDEHCGAPCRASTILLA